jgi:hypothetical protein
MRAADFLIVEAELQQRQNRLRQAISEAVNQTLFEINFNDAGLAKKALSSKIQCGFEAETVWTNISTEADEPDLDYITWSDIEDNLSSRQLNNIQRDYEQWVRETHLDDYLSDAIIEWMRDNYENLKSDFVEDNRRDFDDFVEENTNEDEDLSESDWIDKFIEEEKSDEYDEWLREQAQEDGDVFDEALRLAKRDHDEEDWARDVYYGLGAMALEYGYEVPDNEGNGVEAVASEVEVWAWGASKFKRVKHGGYHGAGGGTSQDYWRVEKDPSIDESGGAGAEVISPVYDTPNEMLKEMQDLFAFMTRNRVAGDDSTGLHVTMSWKGSEGAREPNYLKMILLMGDQYLLKEFNREFNTYTKSQYARIAQYAADLADNMNNDKSLAALEKALSVNISWDKYSTINFKNARNDYGNRLIEFRIGGGEDYLTDFRKVEKTVARYSIAMIAGYDPEAFREDYIRALIRVVESGKRLDPESAKQIPSSIPDKPITKTLQSMVSKTHYVDVMKLLSQAYQNLALSQTQRETDPQRELFTEDATDNSPEWQQTLKYAQSQLAEILTRVAGDIAAGTNRKPVDSSTVIALRNALRDFGLTYATVWPLIINSSTYKNIDMDSHEKEAEFKKAVDRMFKANVGQLSKPAFTIKYNPSYQILYLLTKVADAIFDDEHKSNILLRPEFFKVVSDDELKAVRNANYDYKSDKEAVDRYTRILDALKQKPEENADSIKEQERWLADSINSMELNKAKVDNFMKEYGFIPSQEWEPDFDKPYTVLNAAKVSWLAREYNIQFVK